MGNSCPQGLECADGEKKMCFKDGDGEKYGFCLNTDNKNTVIKISNGEKLCDDCPDAPDYSTAYCPSDLDCGTDKTTVCWSTSSGDKKGLCISEAMNPIYTLQKEWGDKTYSNVITNCISKLQTQEDCASGKYTAEMNHDGGDECDLTCLPETETGVDGYNGKVVNNSLMNFIFFMLLLIIVHVYIQKNGKLF